MTGAIDTAPKLRPERIAELRACKNPVFDEILDVLEAQTVEYGKWIDQLDGPTPAELLERWEALKAYLANDTTRTGSARDAIFRIYGKMAQLETSHSAAAPVSTEPAVETELAAERASHALTKRLMREGYISFGAEREELRARWVALKAFINARRDAVGTRTLLAEMARLEKNEADT